MRTTLKRQYSWTASANVGKLPILPVSKASGSIRAASKLVGTVARYWILILFASRGVVWIEQCRNVSICCVGITWFWWTVLQLTVGRIPSTNMEQKHSWISWDETPPPISDKKSTFCLTGSFVLVFCWTHWALHDFLSPNVLAPMCACSSQQLWEIKFETQWKVMHNVRNHASKWKTDNQWKQYNTMLLYITAWKRKSVTIITQINRSNKSWQYVLRNTWIQ